MTSSTSASRAGPWLASVLGSSLVLGAGLGLLMQGGGQASPVAAMALDQLSRAQATDTVLLGNSVTMASLDAEQLGAASTALSGGQPAHWIAMLGRAEPLKPRRYVLYASPMSLDEVELEPGEDEEILVALLSGPDEELMLRATGEGGLWRQFQVRRVSLRRSLVEGLGHSPVEASFGRMTQGPVVDPALRRVLPQEGPVDKVEAVARGERGKVEAEPWPDRASLEASLMPMLIERVQAQGARLVVVLPPSQRPQSCSPQDPLAETRAWWAEQPLDLVDLSAWSVGGGHFDRDYHANPRGKERITQVLGQRLAELPLEPGAPPVRQSCD